MKNLCNPYESTPTSIGIRIALNCSCIQATDKGTQMRMLPTIALLTILVIPTMGNAQSSNYRPWESSYETAIKKSKATGLPIMLVFTGSDWSHWSQRLSTEVLASRKFARWSSSNVIKFEVDFPRTVELPRTVSIRNGKLLAQFKDHVTTYPTILFIDANENVLASSRYKGDGIDAWLTEVGRALYRKYDKVAAHIRFVPFQHS